MGKYQEKHSVGVIINIYLTSLSHRGVHKPAQAQPTQRGKAAKPQSRKAD